MRNCISRLLKSVCSLRAEFHRYYDYLCRIYKSVCYSLTKVMNDTLIGK